MCPLSPWDHKQYNSKLAAPLTPFRNVNPHIGHLPVCSTRSSRTAQSITQPESIVNRQLPALSLEALRNIGEAAGLSSVLEELLVQCGR